VTVLEITSDEYHADKVAEEPALSASIANVLITQSPAHAWANHPKLNPFFTRKAEDKFDLGTAVHAVLLEGRDRVAVIDRDDWRTNAAKQERQEAREAGLIPLLSGQWESVQPMFDAVRAQLAEHEAQPTPFTAGKPEQTLIWEEHGVTLKARLDWLHDDLSAIDDFKSTRASAHPQAWQKTLFGMGADVQAAFYLRGVRAVLDAEPAWRWVVVECEPPFALSVVTLAPDALAIAEDKVNHAIRLWRACIETGKWPGYPRQVATVDALPWAEAQWLERRDESAS
jgi:hypothetical protein